MTLGEQLLQFLVSMQYGMAATLLKGVEDFLAGPAVLADGGVAVSAAIRALRTEYPDTHRLQPSDLAATSADMVPIAVASATPSLPGAVLVKRALYQLAGLTRGPAAVTARDAKWWHVSLFNEVLVTDSAQDAMRIRRYDRRVQARLARQGARLLARLVRRGPEVRDMWRREMPNLTARENWMRLFSA